VVGLARPQAQPQPRAGLGGTEILDAVVALVARVLKTATLLWRAGA